MDEIQTKGQAIPEYPVGVGELLLIVLGAIALVGAGFTGLYLRVINNAYDPQRVEAIAKTILAYDIPGGAEGFFGLNVGNARFALLRSKTNPPDVILFAGKNPVTRDTQDSTGVPLSSDDMEQQFTVRNSRTETREFCHQPTTITIEEGEQTFANLSLTLPATRYTASLIEANVERTVILIVNGDHRKAKIEAIFRSLRCL